MTKITTLKEHVGSSLAVRADLADSLDRLLKATMAQDYATPQSEENKRAVSVEMVAARNYARNALALHRKLADEHRAAYEEMPDVKNAPRVLVVLEGGNVSNILSDIPIRSRVLDYDTDGAEPEELYRIPQNTEPQTYAEGILHGGEMTSVLPDRITEILTSPKMLETQERQ